MAACDVEWFLSQQKPTIFKIACYPVFRDRFFRPVVAPHWEPLSVRPPDSFRRGSVLIGGNGRRVNADREKIEKSQARLCNHLISHLFRDVEIPDRVLVAFAQPR